MINIQPHMKNIHQEDHAILATPIAAAAANDSFVRIANHGWQVWKIMSDIGNKAAIVIHAAHVSKVPLTASLNFKPNGS